LPTKAVFAGRFDPVTNGHLDIARRAAALFDSLVVGVLDNSTTLFSTDERIDFFKKAVKDLPNVVVKPLQGLTVNFARREGAQVLVRSMRATTDFEAEFDMALMNKRMAPEIESVYFMASLENLFISGSRIREIAGLGYDVRELVPAPVAAALRRKFDRK